MLTTATKPSFGAYLLVFIFPPAYFFSRKRTSAGIFSLILFIVSIPLLFVFVGFFLWFGNAIWAAWNIRYELMNYQINAQAQAIAEKMKNSQ